MGFDAADFALVVEVLSPSNAGGDLIMKRYQYGRAGIPHYWIVDPRERTLTALAHDGVESYVEALVATREKPVELAYPFPVRLDLTAVFD